MAIAFENTVLSAIKAPVLFEIVGFDLAEEDVTRLKVLGICEGREIRLIQNGSPMVLEVLGTSIGISRKLAEGILIQTK